MAELSFHPDILKNVQKEIDEVFPELSQFRDKNFTSFERFNFEEIMTSERLSELKVLDRVVKESLRLHPPARSNVFIYIYILF